MTLPTPSQTAQAFHFKCSAKPALSLAALLLLTACQNTPRYQDPPAFVVSASTSSDTDIQHSVSGARAQPNAPLTAELQNWQPSWIAQIESSFEQARSLVEKQLQIDLADIELNLVDDASINTEVSLETSRLIDEQFGHTTFAEQFLDQVMHPLAGTYAALYSSRLKSVMISRTMLTNYERTLAFNSDDATRKAALLTLLIHELVHAADDKRYNIHDNRALNFRASFAQSATFEGHAQWATRQICKLADCSAGLKALDNFMFSTDEQSEQSTQPIEAVNRNVLEYSYIEGERFISDLAKRDNGKQLIDQLLSTPPLDPIQILSPETYPNVAREALNQRLLLASRNVLHPWASSPWIGIETSPLKGIDLRSDPIRRQAAIDGFTQLIRGMVSIQFYNQLKPEAPPLEATVLQAESAATARLFANIMHNNTHHSDAQISNESLSISDEQTNTIALDVHIYRTSIGTDNSYRTAIAISDQHVVQVSGNTSEIELLDDYAIRVLLNLRQAKPDA